MQRIRSSFEIAISKFPLVNTSRIIGLRKKSNRNPRTIGCWRKCKVGHRIWIYHQSGCIYRSVSIVSSDYKGIVTSSIGRIIFLCGSGYIRIIFFPLIGKGTRNSSHIRGKRESNRISITYLNTSRRGSCINGIQKKTACFRNISSTCSYLQHPQQ